MQPVDTVTIQCDIRNSGARTGDEVVQLYTRDPVASFTRPVRELKQFKRISLPPGATTTVTFRLSAMDLAYPGADYRPILEPGVINIMVGSSSEDIRLNGIFDVVEGIR